MENLTGNDVALALQGVQHMQAWWKKRKASYYQKKELAKVCDLNKKLSGILDEAYPEPVAADAGDDVIFVPASPPERIVRKD